MTRNFLNLVIDSITALAMAAMLATGLMVRYLLPPGSGSRRLLWGYGRHDWGDVHFWLAVAVVAIVLLHVALHWRWICAMFVRMVPGGKKGSVGTVRRNISGVAVIVAVAALFIGFVKVAQRSVSDSAATVAESGGRHGEQEGRDAEQRASAENDGSGPFIQGSMTLAEVAQTCGLSLETVRTQLNVAEDEPADERLGRLSKKYGFAMQDARDKLNAKVATSD